MSRLQFLMSPAQCGMVSFDGGHCATQIGKLGSLTLVLPIPVGLGKTVGVALDESFVKRPGTDTVGAAQKEALMRKEFE
jgi:hypothetical protein